MNDAAQPEDFWKLKEKFRNAAREDWPNVDYPELPWLFERMGIDPSTVVQYPISKKKYKVFLFDDEGKRVRHPNGDTVQVYREFTSEQKKLVKEWWELLPQDMVIA